jgi:CHASE3 domain sensor protein
MNKLLTGLVLMSFLACRENKPREEKKEEVKAGLEKIQQDMKETANAAADYLSEQKKKVADDLEERRKEIDQKIETLRYDSTGRGAQARKKLTGLRNDINKKLEDLKGASAATWDSTQLKIDTLLKKSDKEWTEFKKDFKELFQ